MKRRLKGLIVIAFLALTGWVAPSSAQHRMGPAAKLAFPEGKQVLEIPFEFVHEKILIPVRVNGSEPMTFVLDTGAPVAVFMDSERAKTLDLKIVGNAVVGGAGEGEASTVPVAGDVMFEVGGIEITGAMMAIGVGEGKLPDLGWDGVIGRPIFANLVVEFDFLNQIMRLYPPEHFAYNGNGAELPLTIAGGSFPYIDAAVSIDGGASVPATLVIDTGAGHALSLSVENHDELQMPDEKVELILGWGANGAVRGHTGRVARLELGDYVLHDVVTGFPDPSGMHMLAAMGQTTRHGILGAKSLKRFRVIIDYTNTRLILEPNSAFESPFTFNTAGLVPKPWAPGAEFVEVAYVIASSPAQTAGIDVGDHITAIDGRPVADISADDIDDLLKQAPGSKITLTILRDSEKVKKGLVLRKLI